MSDDKPFREERPFNEDRPLSDDRPFSEDRPLIELRPLSEVVEGASLSWIEKLLSPGEQPAAAKRNDPEARSAKRSDG